MALFIFSVPFKASLIPITVAVFLSLPKARCGHLLYSTPMQPELKDIFSNHTNWAFPLQISGSQRIFSYFESFMPSNDLSLWRFLLPHTLCMSTFTLHFSCMAGTASMHKIGEQSNSTPVLSALCFHHTSLYHALPNHSVSCICLIHCPTD